jgi:hypothetical protein
VSVRREGMEVVVLRFCEDAWTSAFCGRIMGYGIMCYQVSRSEISCLSFEYVNVEDDV